MGRVARYTLLYYAATTALAVFLGILLVNIMRPGSAGVPGHAAGLACSTAAAQASLPQAHALCTPIFMLIGEICSTAVSVESIAAM